MMKKLIVILPIFFILGASCSRVQIEPTPLPTIQPTPTVDIASINLEDILFQDGDLPAGYSLTQITHSNIPFLEDKNSLAVNWIRGDVAYENDGVGGINVGLSTTEEESLSLYNLLIESLGTDEIDEAGVKTKFGNSVTTNGTEISYDTLEANLSERGLMDLKTITTTFHKCRFTGYFVLVGTNEPDEVINYIERLSFRLAEILECE